MLPTHCLLAGWLGGVVKRANCCCRGRDSLAVAIVDGTAPLSNSCQLHKDTDTETERGPFNWARNQVIQAPLGPVSLGPAPLSTCVSFVGSRQRKMFVSAAAIAVVVVIIYHATSEMDCHVPSQLPANTTATTRATTTTIAAAST